ncbi:hypothetical protein JQS43_06105 [Natronosporangium hydrolyticum]|uniref:Polysaccharide chain length determinant N-terminal domain-containing protein n=1 Tax=Natronosporangium hydrolyticum TaxID=2811111 RepID=A0A895YKT4_9ACTN|nr:Wzz/FepE/Etk N-terminal domain-containing protein [Natronosporangium hydrolyticum]QSB15903.1 hypothetical protein JQS43_06105 [Natronosporangium hydrolyticum]
MVDQAATPQPTLADLLEWVLRRWWIVVLSILVAGGVSGLAAVLQSPTYASSTLVQVQQVGPESAESRLNLDTEAQVVRSIDTASRVGEMINSTEPPAELARRVNVLVPPNTTFLEISFEAGTPERAQAGAHAFAEAYLAQREETAQQEVNDRIERLSNQIEALRAQQADEQVVLPLLHQQLLLQSEPIRGGDVRSPANLPGQPSSPNRTLYLASGLVAGLLLGLAAALLVHRFDRRVFRAADLPAEVVDQVLLELAGSRPAAQVMGPTTPMGRQFSRLRNVMRANADARSPGGAGSAPGVLLVCGVSAGTAAGFVTANLAAAFARAGERVAVVASDSASAVFEALGVSAGPGRGLADVLAGAVAPGDATVPSPVVNRVSVLRPGRLDEREELTVGETMGVVLRLASGVDRVIIESPPMARSIDAQALGVTASALLLVAECQRTTGPEVAAAVRDFQQVHAPFAGVLLVSPSGRARRGAGPTARIIPSFVDSAGDPAPSADAAPSAGPAKSPAPKPPPPPGQPQPGPRPPASGSPPSAPDDTVVLGRIQSDRGSS